MSQEEPYSTIYELILVDEDNNTPVHLFTCVDGAVEERLNDAMDELTNNNSEALYLGHAIERLNRRPDLLTKHGLAIGNSDHCVIEARYYQDARLEIES